MNALLDAERCYRAVASRDARFDGWFFTAVHTTGIYCRPSCPARTPLARNVTFHTTAAGAQDAGFRACRRCRPDAVPGSPEWDVRADVVARAMRLIADGEVERTGVPGLAGRLGYSERQLNRLLVGELGVGPLALARAQRAQTARLLIETTTLPMADVAFAAGFASIRQFNDTVREVFATTPSALRPATPRVDGGASGWLTLRLAARAPYPAEEVLLFLGAHAVPGLEEWDGTTFSRVLDLPHGPAVVHLSPTVGAPGITARLRLSQLRDLGAAVSRCRRLLDLDADPTAVDEVLGADPALGEPVAAAPGRRVPASPDADELAVRAVLGQQVSVAGARTLTARLLTTAGTPLADPIGTLTHVFPRAAALASADLSAVGLTGARQRTVATLAAALASGGVTLDPGADRAEASRDLLALPGIGPWTVALVAMRGLADPDVWLPGDLAVRRSLTALGSSDTDATTRWQPWRSYAVQHLWALAVPSLFTRPPLARQELVMTARHTTVATPPGPFTVLVTADDDGRDVVLASGWTADVGDLLPVVHASLRPTAVQRVDRLEVVDVVEAFHAGSVAAIDDVAVRQRSGPFLQEAWEVLRTVPAGTPDSYAAFAVRCGRPAAVRAAAGACARNAAALFVPCHRVLATGGGLGGFRWGTPVKRWLLDHEAAHAAVTV